MSCASTRSPMTRRKTSWLTMVTGYCYHQALSRALLSGMEKCSNGEMKIEKNPPDRGDFFFYAEQQRQPAGRRYQKRVLSLGSVPAAAVLLYLRPASATAVLQLGNVLRLIAGGSMLSGYFLFWSYAVSVPSSPVAGLSIVVSPCPAAALLLYIMRLSDRRRRCAANR